MITLQALLKAKWTGSGASSWHPSGKRCPLCTAQRAAGRSYGSTPRERAAKTAARARISVARARHRKCTCKKKPVYEGEWTTTIDTVTFTIKRADGVVAAYADTEFGEVYSDDHKSRRAALEDVLASLRQLVERRQRQAAALSAQIR